ncbi:NAD(P)-dependent oxidoreductase [Sphingomonas alpina]|uniref:NAD(P)-dependent oxidoreductase n=1 Tax=Sphingomonas alpina TaxID=653931 RepID=A0A7H0LIX0_9SPHN|nr:NAD(P)-dependent oxidoreductase [Sphingomonas alpina]QNQ09623.1 NAD(P)-dependent oxidoreductase [Sphingomonas alpina]
MPSLLIFGLGYTAGRLADRLRGEGWRVTGTSRDRRADTIPLTDPASVLPEIAAASHILSSVPPEEDADPVLAAYRDALAGSPAWLGYLSSTGVYGDAASGWVDESAPIVGRRAARSVADGRWLELGARVFRLPGIYGPGRSALERVAEGRAHRVDLPDQVFSRVHVDDIVNGVVAALAAPPGAYNLADDMPCGQDEVMTFAARLLGRPAPPLVDLATLSPAARAFYAENRRVANGKAKRVLGWRPIYPDYRFGLRALSAMTSPIIASTAPAPASSDQR